MIPTVLLAALLIPKWWSIPIAAVVWPILVIDVIEPSQILAAAALGAVNAAFAVWVRSLTWDLFRRGFGKREPKVAS